MFNRWTRAVLRQRTAVVITWTVLAVLGLSFSGALSARLTTSLNVPHSGSGRANEILARHFHENVEGSFTIVVTGDGESPASIERRTAVAVASIPTGQVLQSKEIGGVLYVEADTNLDLAGAAARTDQLRRALVAQGLGRALVTGPAALQSDMTPVLKSDLRRGEFIALALALMLLVLLLGVSAVVAIPFVVAVVTITTSLLVVYLLSHLITMVLYVPNVIELIGLGLAIDYSLLIVHRFRKEIAGATTSDAVVATVAQAGRTVVISSLAVMVGLATLLLVPVPFLRSLGVAGIAVTLVSSAAALTLQPVLLSLCGARGLRSLGRSGLMGESDRLAAGWSALARFVLRRPAGVLATGVAVVVLIAAPAAWLQLTPGSLSAIPASLASARANAFMSHHVGPGVITPDQVVLVAPPGLNWSSATGQREETRLATLILAEPEVADVAIGDRSPYVDATGRYAQIFVVGRHQFGAPESQQLVSRIRRHDVPAARLTRGVRVYVGGAPAQGVDFLERLYGSFAWVVTLALASALVILWRAFRSFVVALLAIVGDLLSVVAAYGVTVAVFRFGVLGPWWGTYRVDQIEGWVPVFVFAMLFGLSMDYEVFIVARMREARDAGAAWDSAIISGLSQTGGVISAAALIMVGALSGLVGGHVAGLQELGVALSAGVLIDASLVRGVIMPACLALLGERAWR
ncbi:MAG: MMPL family transporter [Acidobacteria bacterium]|nr:MMPL family transporter [Acidobacteriota bacterium]